MFSVYKESLLYIYIILIFSFLVFSFFNFKKNVTSSYLFKYYNFISAYDDLSTISTIINVYLVIHQNTLK